MYNVHSERKYICRENHFLPSRFSPRYSEENRKILKTGLQRAGRGLGEHKTQICFEWLLSLIHDLRESLPDVWAQNGQRWIGSEYF